MRNRTHIQNKSDINIKLIWEQLLKSNPGPDNSQLSHLVIRSEQLGEKALDQLFKQNPSTHELYIIMRDAKPAFKEKAFEQLAAHGKSVYNKIVSAIIKIPELRETAWKTFIELDPDGKDLRLIAEQIESLRLECWKIIITQRITNDELIHLMQDYEELREKAWSKLVQREHTSRELCRIIEHVKELRHKAWASLMKKGVINDELYYLIDHVPAIRKVAEYKLYKETEDVMQILREVQ